MSILIWYKCVPWLKIQLSILNEGYGAEISQGPFHEHGLPLISVWISNHMSSEMWDEIIYPFPSFKGCTLVIWELISDYITQFVMDVITYLCCAHCIIDMNTSKNVKLNLKDFTRDNAIHVWVATHKLPLSRSWTWYFSDSLFDVWMSMENFIQ